MSRWAESFCTWLCACIGLQAKGLLLKHGTVVDATLIAAPSSTKNEALNFEIARLKRWRFGSSSESLDTRTQAVLFDYILLDTALEDRAADETKKPAASPSRPKG